MSFYDKISSHYTQTRKKYPWASYFEFAKYLTSKMKLLDVGCGGGRVLDFFKLQNIEIDYIGIDISKGMINECKKQFPKEKFIQMDMRKLDFPDNFFDIIFAFASFHHLDSYSSRIQTLNEFKRVLKPNGILCMTNWNFSGKRFFWNPLIQIKRLFDRVYIPWKDNKGKMITTRYYHGFYKNELRGLFKNSIFKILDEFYENRDGRCNFYQGMNICHVVRKPSK